MICLLSEELWTHSICAMASQYRPGGVVPSGRKIRLGEGSEEKACRGSVMGGLRWLGGGMGEFEGMHIGRSCDAHLHAVLAVIHVQISQSF